MMEWQPIETAPKDGTVVLAACFSPPWRDSHLKGDVVKCWWEEEFNEWIESCQKYSLAKGSTLPDGSRQSLHSPVIARYRSHWMPLPPPPKDTP